jgi:transposase
VVVDHFHAVRLANAVVDQLRRRTQQTTLGHRGRKQDPLYRIRKLLLTAQEQLTSRGRARLRAGLRTGDLTGEVAAAWQGKELLRAVYRAVGMPAAPAALDRFYRWCDGVQIPELASQSCGLVSLPRDAAVQQQPQPIVGEVAKAVPDALDL